MFLYKIYLKSCDARWKGEEVEGTPDSQHPIFPFSKPSPFSSMTDWPFGSQHTMTHPPKCSQTPKQAEHNMDPQTLQSKMHEEITKFQKTMEEFHLLKAVSQDLKKYRTMTALKKFD